VYEEVVLNTKRLFEARLVHGDLSEYNILLRKDEVVLIDLSQAVPVDHHLAEELLKRDAKNVARFFGKKFDKVYDSIIS
jgi:RIO kinase 1